MNNISVINPDSREYARHEIATYVVNHTSSTAVKDWKTIEVAGYDLLEHVAEVVEFGNDPLDEELITEVEGILYSALTFLHAIKLRHAVKEDS